MRKKTCPRPARVLLHLPSDQKGARWNNKHDCAALWGQVRIGAWLVPLVVSVGTERSREGCTRAVFACDIVLVCLLPAGMNSHYSNALFGFKVIYGRRIPPYRHGDAFCVCWFE